MRSDVASPASRELSMSGRSARGKQTVDKIFNTALPVHGSNTTEETYHPKSKRKKIKLSSLSLSEQQTAWTCRNKGAKDISSVEI